MTAGVDQDEIAAELARLFIERRDVKAVQQQSGAYKPVRSKFTMGDLRAHLAGETTIGHYLVSPNGARRVIAFDIDLNASGTYSDELGIEHEYNPREAWLAENHPARPRLAQQLRWMAEGLAFAVESVIGIPPIVATSGSKGLHVYGFPGPSEAALARREAEAVLERLVRFELVRGKSFYRHPEFPDLTIEVYPKQTEVSDLGNLMKLPLGVDQRTGHRSYFLDLKSPADDWRADDPLDTLLWGSTR